LDWLRRRLGGGSTAVSPAEVKRAPTPPIRRNRDEPTTFIAPPQPAEPTEVVEASGSTEPVESGADATVPVDPADELDVTTTVPIEEPVSEAAAPDPADLDTTLVLPTSEPETAADPDATLYLEVPRPVVATLEAVRGELLGEKYELREGENLLGRSPESDVVLPSMWISRAHAKVVCEGDRIQVVALSDKITTVDDEPASEGAEATDGCEIQLGGTRFRLEVEK
jgi:hypothetical protein